MKSENSGYAYPVTLHFFFSSPKHNYFAHPRFEPGDAPTLTHQKLSLSRDRGIGGDRFETGRYPLTFFSLEVAEAIEKELGSKVDMALFRRNIVISGINLCELIGRRFRIGGVLFEGMAHCNPCPWMNAMIGEGVYAMMKGRGGLRAKVIEGGELLLGGTRLESDTMLLKEAIEPLVKSRLPKG